MKIFKIIGCNKWFSDSASYQQNIQKKSHESTLAFLTDNNQIKGFFKFILKIKVAI